MQAIPPDVAERLGYYVYLYIDPRDGKPFYVGKGQGGRVLAHLSDRAESRKVVVLDELKAAGLEPHIDILAHDLPAEETAYYVEAAVLDLLGLSDLTNLVRGHGSVTRGRTTLADLTIRYAAKPVEIIDPVVLIRINKVFRHDMTAEELYDATRGTWRADSGRLASVRYALAIFDGVVREVYAIDGWHPAGSTAYATRVADELMRQGRFEFTGSVAPDEVRNRYLGGHVRSYVSQGAQNPLKYVNA